ncbi:MAG: chemotaxis protein methyltransferase CheR, partial [Halothiobacillaceae bacterium]
RQVVPYLLTQRKHLRKIRIWSAGCSTGEEPYSLAMTLAETLPTSPTWDVKILATDLDTNVLAKARAGLYGIERIESVNKNRVKRWFLKGAGEHEGCVKVASQLQEMIAFNQLNLMKEWPMQGPFDVIFCRNVVIYFDKETQARLFARYADLLANDGYLFVGHSESLFKVTDKFSLIGQTIYQKNGTERNDKI